MTTRSDSILIAAACLLQTGVTGAATDNTAAPPAGGIEINARVRKEVLDSLAHALETQYVIPDTANKLAAMVRAKEKSNAY